MKKILIFIIAIILISCKTNDENNLFAFKNSDGEWGYFNKKGEIVIPPQFKNAHSFNDGYARVQVEFNDKTKYTFIDKNGNYDISKSWDVAKDFSNGLALVRNNLGYPMAINKNLEIAYEFKKADIVSNFSKSRCLYYEINSDSVVSFLLDKNKDTLQKNIDKKFAPQKILSKHLISKPIYETENNLSISLYSDNGKLVSNLQSNFCYISEYSSKVAMAKTCSNKWGLIDENGKILLNPQFDKMFRDGENYIVQIGEKWGWINNEGKNIINPQFSDIRNRGFNNTELAAVKIGNKWGYIDKEGKIEINPRFDSASYFHGNVAIVYTKKAGHGIIDSKGNYIVNPQFDDVLPEYYEIYHDYNLSDRGESNREAYLNTHIYSDYIDVDTIINTIDLNINKSGIYGVNFNDFNILDIGELKPKDQTFKGLDRGYYAVGPGQIFMESFYQDGNYYNSNFYRGNISSSLQLSGDMAKAAKSIFKFSMIFMEPPHKKTLKPVLELEEIYTYYNESVFTARKTKQGFNEIVEKTFNPGKFNFKNINKLIFSFKFKTLSRDQKHNLQKRLNESFDGVNRLNKNNCFKYDFNVQSDGKIELTLSRVSNPCSISL